MESQGVARVVFVLVLVGYLYGSAWLWGAPFIEPDYLVAMIFPHPDKMYWVLAFAALFLSVAIGSAGAVCGLALLRGETAPAFASRITSELIKGKRPAR